MKLKYRKVLYKKTKPFLLFLLLPFLLILLLCLLFFLILLLNTLTQ